MSDIISPMATNTMTRRDVGESLSADRPEIRDRAVVARDTAQSASAPASSADVEAAVAALQQVVESASQRRLQFNVHDETESVFVEVTDAQTGDVIRTIPSEDALELHARIADIVGAFVDTQA